MPESPNIVENHLLARYTHAPQEDTEMGRAAIGLGATVQAMVEAVTEGSAVYDRTEPQHTNHTSYEIHAPTSPDSAEKMRRQLAMGWDLGLRILRGLAVSEGLENTANFPEAVGDFQVANPDATAQDPPLRVA